VKSAFRDHFSGHASLYARYRPRYPSELYDWLAAQAPGRELAWDCGAGNGQAAVALAGLFRRVIATDASAEQLGNAPPHPAVEFRVETAEHSTLESGSADLVFVSQALHWFEPEPFYAEVRRVLRPAGLLAAVTYLQLRVGPAVDAVIDHFYHEVVGPYWPPERRHVEQGYASLPFPFERIETPEFVLRQAWRLADLLGYLSTWSSVQRYWKACGEDPLAGIVDALGRAWGDPSRVREVRWPLVLLAGRPVSRKD